MSPVPSRNARIDSCESSSGHINDWDARSKEPPAGPSIGARIGSGGGSIWVLAYGCARCRFFVLAGPDDDVTEGGVRDTLGPLAGGGPSLCRAFTNTHDDHPDRADVDDAAPDDPDPEDVNEGATDIADAEEEGGTT
ncbi:hypothetical protein PUNSTDRAFT_55155 [Punctularia strigosozonata HHB-11173 SS5]|uniref:Uncharacterized protein n=1 Tax=Punctularia strigosozonata (strain HHB-11173) TaxID=741275 RepID=R7S5Y6_PUNST|nr:uncharacterized protein PUNSTDRAFT_55155 [Punctularia strigosozonata HHB-11173 SS5]EIN05281.1 hypothetical protein PUNSTDRAFT_55155 [Punctularia strigosozonata HHB-11173 SS5]